LIFDPKSHINPSYQSGIEISSVKRNGKRIADEPEIRQKNQSIVKELIMCYTMQKGCDDQ